MEKDPLSQVYGALWQMLEDHAGFCNLVPEGNRIKYSGDSRLPEKDTLLTADAPEVRIRCEGIRPTAGKSFEQVSGGTLLSMRFKVQMASGDQRYEVMSFPLFWAAFCALLNWRARLLALTWGGQAFAYVCTMANGEIGITDRQLMQGIKGWTTIWAGDVGMAWETAALQAYSGTGSGSGSGS